MAFGSWVYGRPGDRLWVRETWGDGSKFYPHSPIVYAATDEVPVESCRSSAETAAALRRPHQPLEGCCCDFRWRPSIHMPRRASRLTLEVVSVRVERLQAISEEDARAEGVQAAPFCKRGRPTGMEHVEAFEDLWDSINGQRASWASDPWVWAVEFKRVEAF